MRTGRTIRIVVVAAVAMLGAQAAMASIVKSSVFNNGTDMTGMDPISSTDLLQTPALSSELYSGPGGPLGGSWATVAPLLHNGTANFNAVGLGRDNGNTPAVVTYQLDTSGSGSSTGYSLSQINTYVGRGDRWVQDYNLYLSFVDSPTTWVLQNTAAGLSAWSATSDPLAYNDLNDNNHNTEVSWKDSVTPGTSFFATGVAGIRFEVYDIQAGGQSNPQKVGYPYYFGYPSTDPNNRPAWAKYYEIDVVGEATVVPEPATMSLLVLGGIATLLKRRNRR